MSLKTSIGTTACTLLMVGSLHAQSTRFNVRFGPDFAWRDANQTAFESKGRLGIGAGGGFRIGGDAFGLDVNILIVGKESKSVDPLTGGEARLKLQYIEFPMLGVLTMNKAGKIRPFVSAGPVLGLEMRCRQQFVDAQGQDEIACDGQTTATFDRRKVDFSVAGAAGFDYNLGDDRRISFEGRYTHGLRNISDSDDKTLEVRNRAIAFYIGYSFPLKPDI